jgi:hypothetical protein
MARRAPSAAPAVSPGPRSWRAIRNAAAAAKVVDAKGAPMKTQRERAAVSRAVKLADVQEQVDSGSLVIRQMTETERLRYPPVASRAARQGPKSRHTYLPPYRNDR